MEELLYAAALGILATVCSLVIKKENPAGAYVLTVGVGVVFISFALRLISPVVSFIKELSELSGLAPPIIYALIKVIGISIVTKTAAEACRDAKENAIGAYAEMAGNAAALLATLPLMSAVLSEITAMLTE